MRTIFIIIFLVSTSIAQVIIKTNKIENVDQVKLFNRVEVLESKRFDNLIIRVLGVHNDSGSAGFESCEVNTNIYIAVSEYGEYPDQSLYLLSPLYSAEILKISEEDSKPTIYLSFIYNQRNLQCVRIIALLSNIEYSLLEPDDFIVIENPSIIFFHPPDEEIAKQSNSDDSGIVEVISDFNYYSEKIKTYIIEKNIKPIFSYAEVITLWQKNSEPIYYFRKDFGHSVGYIMTTIKKKPIIHKGVFTDFDIKQEIDKYFNIDN